MEFKIIENPKYTNRIDFGLHLNPDNDPLKFFFSSMRKEGFPDLIQGAIRGEGYIGSPEGVFFFGDLDGEDFAEGNIFKEHEVKVYHDNFGEIDLLILRFIAMDGSMGFEFNRECLNARQLVINEIDTILYTSFV